VGAAAVKPALLHVWLDPQWFEGIAPAEAMLLMGLPFVSLFAIGAMLVALNFQKQRRCCRPVDGRARVASGRTPAIDP
jgi:hypothetical protein